MIRDMDKEVEERLTKPFAKNLRKPSALEIKRYLRIAKGCPKSLVSEVWMKNMMNWDLYTHPRSLEFANSTSLTEKIALAQDWKDFMEKKRFIFLSMSGIIPSFTISIKTSSAPLISCPVHTLSLSDLGKKSEN
jgi:hypothetical protein